MHSVYQFNCLAIIHYIAFQVCQKANNENQPVGRLIVGWFKISSFLNQTESLALCGICGYFEFQFCAQQCSVFKFIFYYTKFVANSHQICIFKN